MEHDSSHDQSRRRFLKSMAIATGAAALPGLAFKEAFGASTSKTPKADVQYKNTPRNGQMCAHCMYFLPGRGKGPKGKCKLVQGAISPHGWCILYTQKPK
jgi:anaerobic selenocysteine-containing dehydrogenase